MKNYRDLKIWQKADNLVKFIYISSAKWPIQEKFGLISQIRRTAISVPTNIVEGWARFSDKEFKKFLIIARGSLYETEYLWNLAKDLGYLDQKDFLKGQELIEENSKLLNKFIKTMKDSIS